MFRRIHPLHSACLFSFLGLLAVACPEGSALEDPQRFLEPAGVGGDAGEACDAKPIFAARCAGSICHEGDGNSAVGGVDLLAPGVEQRLLAVPATYTNVSNLEDCPEQPELLIDPDDPTKSLLLTKIFNTHQCGTGMPTPNPPGLPENERTCIENWVAHVIETGGDGGGMGGATGTGGAPSTGGGDGSGGAGESPVVDPLRIQAECAFGAAIGDCDGRMGSSLGDAMLEPGDTAVGYFSDGTWLSYSGVDLTGYDRLRFHYAKESTGGSIEVRIGSATGTLLGTLTPTGTGAWSTYADAEIEITPVEGVHDVFVVATETMYVANLDWIEFFKQ